MSESDPFAAGGFADRNRCAEALQQRADAGGDRFTEPRDPEVAMLAALSDIYGVATALLEMDGDHLDYLGSRLLEHFREADAAYVRLTGNPGVVTPLPEKRGSFWCFSLADPDAPLHLLADGAYRLADDLELTEHLLREPWHTENVAPEILRRLLPGHDGEFFALMAERKSILGSTFDHTTWSHTPEGCRQLDENLGRLCETPVVTDAGAAMRLQLLMSSTWGGEEGLTVVRTRQLLWGALAWLYQRDFRKCGVERRPVDVEKQVAGLRGYANPGPRDVRVECPLPSEGHQVG